MKLSDIDEATVNAAIEDFYRQVSSFMDSVASVMANRRYSLPRIGRRRGYQELPYFYAVDLAELFDYARGTIHMGPIAVEQRCEAILAILFSSVSGLRSSPNWLEFGETPLGLCILACGARLRLRQNKPLTANHVMVLAGWSEKHVVRSGLLPFDTQDDEPVFHADDVIQAFRTLGIAI
ncbi:MAG: hypothetical protein VX223_15350 [Myxococcota bacterium]|nr:hypothetical protein [Myxococcota bacterium]